MEHKGLAIPTNRNLAVKVSKMCMNIIPQRVNLVHNRNGNPRWFSPAVIDVIHIGFGLLRVQIRRWHVPDSYGFKTDGVSGLW